MKRFKKIIHNCPYLIALLVTWLFLTLGGIVLMIYRDYGCPEWKKFWSNPFFALIMKEEMYIDMSVPVSTDYAKAEASGQNQLINEQNKEKVPYVISNITVKNNEKSNADIINEMLKTYGGDIKGENSDREADEASILGIRREEKESEEEQLVSAKQQDETSLEKDDMEKKRIEERSKTAAEEEKNTVVGKTAFVTYTPVETNSSYYYDVGKIAMTTEYPYMKVEEDYFEDAAFFGDSRTLGISDYAELGADFYCENGMTIYKLLDEKGVVCQNSKEKADLNQVLQNKQYGKIYIMLGMNELGYRDTEYFKEQYKVMLDQIRQLQPQAVIYIMANLHVSQEKNNNATEFNNININAKNVAIAELADGTDVFYLDSNPLFTDNDGFLKADLTFDGVHLYADNYAVWREFLMEHGVVRSEARN